jgi:hypothetical protein
MFLQAMSVKYFGLMLSDTVRAIILDHLNIK